MWGNPDAGIVDSGAIRTGRGGDIHMVKSPAVQGFEITPQPAGMFVSIHLVKNLYVM